MTRRFPKLLWRYLSADLARLALLTGTALVMVIAFGASIKFLADGKIDLGGAIIVMALAIVPMLQYALPFAGGFAATLTYHRLASDNEATAAMAGGVSHRALLLPAILIGFVLLIGVLVLSHEIIPHFLRQMERRVRSDLTGVLERTIQRGDSINLGTFQIYADDMIKIGPDPESGAIDRFQLQGVLAMQPGGDAGIKFYISAETVNVWMFEEADADGPITTMQFEFRNATGDWPGYQLEEKALLTERIPIRDTFVNRPKFNTFAQLRALRLEPQRMRNIEGLRRVLALRLAERDLIRAVRARLETDGKIALDRPGGERVVVSARALLRDGKSWKFAPGRAGKAIRIDRRQQGLSPFVQEAHDVWLEFESNAPNSRSAIPAPTIQLRALGAVAVDERSPTGTGALPETRIPSLALVTTRQSPTSPKSLDSLLHEAARVLSEGEIELRDEIATAARRLHFRNEKLQREITSLFHERAAYGVACLLTVLGGAVVALRRRDAMPLPVYLWSFLPALVAIITIGAGQDLVHSSGSQWLVLLWGGLISFLALITREYTLLRRH